MRRGLAALLVALAALAPLGAQAPVFRASVSAVRVDVLATDGGRPISGLTADDFEVTDNGVPQAITSVLGDREPLDVLFTFDRSASTRGETLMRLRESASALLDALQPEDRAGLLTFNHIFELRVPQGPPEAVRRALEQIEPEGSTAIFDAATAAMALTATSSRRTLVLLFTDGVDTISWVPERVAVESARGSEAVMYAVTLPERRNAGQPVMGDAGPLRRLAEATGGRLLQADAPTQLRDRFIDTLREMRARYVLTYTASDSATPGWHALSVRLRHHRGRVSARAGYVVPPHAE